jgi:hypothetical protein
MSDRAPAANAAQTAAAHRPITECRARILYRGTEIASYNEPKAPA